MFISATASHNIIGRGDKLSRIRIVYPVPLFMHNLKEVKTKEKDMPKSRVKSSRVKYVICRKVFKYVNT
jgi:hypothetical protein